MGGGLYVEPKELTCQPLTKMLVINNIAMLQIRRGKRDNLGISFILLL